MHKFVPEYSHALSKRLAPSNQDMLIQKLLEATNFMMKNLNPDRTLEQAFDEVFFPELKITREEVQTDIDEFYLSDFPKLEKVTEFIPDAVQTVKEAINKGWQIAIATNPLFPYTAIYQRLSWAGLTGKNFPWKIIPNYETFHFAKPQPEYYAELLGQMGWPEGPVVMVGNDKQMDIDPAYSFGMASYWVNNNIDIENQPGSRHAQGPISELFKWLDNTDIDTLKIEGSSPRNLLAILRATIASLSTMTKDLPKDIWKRKKSPNEWCLTEIICHLRDVDEEVNIPRMKNILKNKNPFITGRDTDVWASERNYINQDGLESLQSYLTARLKLIDILKDIKDCDWNLTARHSIFGPIQLKELVNITTSHDKLHLQTVYQLLEDFQFLDN